MTVERKLPDVERLRDGGGQLVPLLVAVADVRLLQQRELLDRPVDDHEPSRRIEAVAFPREPQVADDAEAAVLDREVGDPLHLQSDLHGPGFGGRTHDRRSQRRIGRARIHDGPPVALLGPS